jgi:Arc/MetJ-type ribon-helix-helix transcriptional regulator
VTFQAGFGLAQFANIGPLASQICHVSLMKDCDKFVERSVNSDQYLSARKVVREDLLLLGQKVSESKLRLERLRKAATAGADNTCR